MLRNDFGCTRFFTCGGACEIQQQHVATDLPWQDIGVPTPALTGPSQLVGPLEETPVVPAAPSGNHEGRIAGDMPTVHKEMFNAEPYADGLFQI